MSGGVKDTDLNLGIKLFGIVLYTEAKNVRDSAKMMLTPSSRPREKDRNPAIEKTGPANAPTKLASLGSSCGLRNAWRRSEEAGGLSATGVTRTTCRSYKRKKNSPSERSS